MTEKPAPEPIDLVFLDEASPKPIAVDAKAFARFEARIESALEQLVARYPVRANVSIGRMKHSAK